MAAFDHRSMGDVVAISALRRLPPGAWDELWSTAGRRRVQPGDVVQFDGERRPHVHLVVSGLVRMALRAEDGRTMTVRYCRPGSLIGVASLFAPEFRLPVTIEGVTTSELIDFDPVTVRRLAESDAAVALALLEETGERVQTYVEEIARTSFATVTQRIARHLLDLSRHDGDGDLVVDVTQEELAAAVGTVREVAARALRGLRDREVVRTERNRVLIVDPTGLVDATGG